MLVRPLLIVTASSAMLLGSCGHSSTTADSYSETISLEEMIAEAPEEAGYSADSIFDAPAEDSQATPGDTLSLDSSATAALLASGEDMPEQSAPQKEREVIRLERNRIKVNHFGRFGDVFNDSNYLQLQQAERLGITPVSDLRSIYRTRRPLVKINSCNDFIVDELTHSYPYLVPEAASLLHDIGRNFRDSLKSRGGGDYRIIVTSVLRTPATVKRLKRVNRNAVEKSTHQYATTFDITYNRFASPDGKSMVASEDFKGLLGEIIRKMHAEGRCMVKYEYKSPCFHITVAR